ncbi:peptidoglycan-binding protein [Oscillatoria sp. FACHB-1407]|uniref:cysteine peptidase family C39 domain-containing protein n=1 Tax=Oscillatoria sp. FACHB-1407 TaxID=2692847 RepID=UPI0016826647|nr:cysteine peptidase family C39 domain-containing protein [Oscillatoria sp. FACHB-1407]MBD2462071.1 peptidoglycan-binding protein [Oscillatoria sp. FACHB-1407]
MISKLSIYATFLLGALAFWWGIRLGRLLLRRGATADNLFKGKDAASLAFLGLYFALMFLVLHVPQMQELPLMWRVHGMQVTWTFLRVILLGMCGVGFIISWKTARLQVIAVVLVGLLGLGGFTAAEAYFLQPIHASLRDNLRPNGVFQQTSSSSCAPAALATILHRWGLNATESDVARYAGTSRLGTSMPQLIVAARELGMDGIELSPTWEQMQQINRPGVLATWLYGQNGRVAHATALLGLSDEVATIADPAFGRIYRVTRSQFDRIWRRTYVPIYRPTDALLSPNQAATYLQKLGFWQQATPVSNPERSPNSASAKGKKAGDGSSALSPTGQGMSDTVQLADLTAAIQQFQTAMALRPTGELDAETVLFLTGPFLQEVPILKSQHSPDH